MYSKDLFYITYGFLCIEFLYMAGCRYENVRMLKHKDMIYCTVSCTKCGGMLYLYTTCNTFKEKNKEFLQVISQVAQSEY